ncbi:MAG: gamma-glutamyl-gamma-aminobutyrate hydrolase family protein [Deltaproteobacteria bacterium]|nr:gamma-glutamyl-gamma-aminobutyrate hydrolase family protein [Deltaproteobacteria bacterium]
MTRPLIGITSYGRNDQHSFPLPAAYIDSIRSAGGIPLIIAPGEKHFRAIVSILDGLIFSGGGDLDPRLYQGQAHESLYMVDDERDQSELGLIELFIKTHKPLFCICRGMQLLNLMRGGNLYEHLPDHFGDRVSHRLPPREPVCHDVRIDPSSKLAEVLATTKTAPASWHHQGVRDLGADLTAVAWAEDQVIEAIESENHPWLIGVQWHPELTFENDPVQRNLFRRFVDACASTKNNRSLQE